MSDSVRPHRQKPTRLPGPWDSPGKNTGVGCHFLLQCRKVKSEREVTQSCPTLSDPMDCSLPGSSVHGIFQARVLAGVGCHCLLRSLPLHFPKTLKEAGCNELYPLPQRAKRLFWPLFICTSCLYFLKFMLSAFDLLDFCASVTLFQESLL